VHVAKPVAVLIHVSEPVAALAWYQAAFPAATQHTVGEPEFQYLRLGDVHLEFVPADEKVSSGPCGTVVYWSVESFNETLAHLQAHGAKLYRGPLNIEGGQRMCQVQDPWGNCIGLRGK
jgi:predicted enzyme related to lactoylglutathione lyase